MSTLLYAAVTALLVSFLLMPLLIRFLRRRQLLDAGGRRKIHKGFVPSMGGIVIMTAFVLSMLLWSPLEDILGLRFEFAAIALVFFAGIRDDIEPLRPSHKLIVQIIAAGMVVVAGDVRIMSFYGLFGITELPVWFSYSISVLFIVAVTNAFNLLDGIDGLAGTMAMCAFTFLALWFYGVGDLSLATRIACVVGAIIGFLYYNWQPASIFMGDTGSLTLGFLLSFTTISFISANGDLPVNNCYKFPAVFSAAVAVVLLPVFDTLRVFLLRIRQGKSPFQPDKQHTHHTVLHLMHTHASSVRVIVFSYILLAFLILFASKYIPDWLLLILILVACTLVDILLKHLVKLSYKRARKRARHSDRIENRK